MVKVLAFIFILLRTIIQVLLVNIRVMKWMLGEFLMFSFSRFALYRDSSC